MGEWFSPETPSASRETELYERGLYQMTIYDFLYLLIEDDEDVRIYDMTAEEEIFCGMARDAMSEFGDYEVMSFDLDRHEDAILCLNIETEEDEED